MPFQMNRVPLGISDLIGARSWPVNPNLMSNELQLAYDARAEFLGSRSTVLAGGSTFNAVQAFTAAPGMQVTAGELWYIHSMAISCAAAGAGISYRARIGFGYQPGGTSLVWIASDAFSAAATERGGVGLVVNQWTPPIAAGINAGMYIQVEQYAGGGNISYSASILYTPITL